jgi:ADP-ribosylglycohydrolase
MTNLPPDYLERVYAGVLGKIIGVYLGRPFEGWTYERITAELGEIWYYVHDRLNKPLIVTDDDISGTFTFIRALEDYPQAGHNLTSRQIGQTWLNYIIENQSILWWGGLGNSTEHTAFLRLKAGIPAPRSGSIALNGRVVAEQIGAQIFIDGWGMVCPGDPEKAAALAAKAGQVSHDGEAVIAAQVIAALEAQAFVEGDLNHLLDTACGLIPPDSTIYRVISDLRAWHAQFFDWRQARQKIAARYGYDKYPGNCHVVPNHALIHLGLLYGADDFQKALMITNTSGWDTDCNSANVGCIMGIKGGLVGIDAGPDWRGPVADRFYLSTAEGGRGIFDAVRQAYLLAAIGRRLAGAPVSLPPKQGARYHFELPGAVQGFTVEDSSQTRGVLRLRNVTGHSSQGQRSLALEFSHLAPGRSARAATAVFIPPDALQMAGYSLSACPSLYPGQTIHARFTAGEVNSAPVKAGLCLTYYDGHDRLVKVSGPRAECPPGQVCLLDWPLTDRAVTPIAQVGIEIEAGESAEGALYLDYLTWDGAPDFSLALPEGSAALWKQAWVQAVDVVRGIPAQAGLNLIQNHGRGMLIQGTRDWTDTQIEAVIHPHLMKSGGIAVRVQGLQRYYALLLKTPGEVHLVKFCDGEETVLAAAPLDWEIERAYSLRLAAQGSRLCGWVEDNLLLDARDISAPLLDGAVALVVEEGYIQAAGIQVAPAARPA